PIVLFAGSCPDDPRVAFKDRHRAESVIRLFAEDVLPCHTLVGGLPDSSCGSGCIQDGRILRVDLQIVDAPTRCRGADAAEVQSVEGRALTLVLHRSSGERSKYGKQNQGYQ